MSNFAAGNEPGSAVPPTPGSLGVSRREWGLLAGTCGAVVLLLVVALAVVVGTHRQTGARIAWRTPSAAGRASASSAAAEPGRKLLPAVPLPDGAPVCGAHLGFLGALSGAAAGFGGSVHQGAQLAVAQYNAAHPTCPVTLVDLDSAGDPTTAVQRALVAVADPRMVGLIGPLMSGEAAATLPTFQRAGLPVITASATAPGLSEGGWSVFHRAIANNTAEGPAAARYIREDLHADKVFVVDDGSPYGTLVAGGARRGLGSAVVGMARVWQGQQTFTDTVARIKASGATVVYYGGYYTEAGPLLHDLGAAGVTARMVGGDGLHDSSLITTAGGSNAEGTAVTGVCVPAKDIDFVTAFRTRFSVEPGMYSGTAYDVANIFLVGIEHGIGTRARMAHFVDTYDGTGVSGGYRFTARGELDPRRVAIGIFVVAGTEFEYVRSEQGQ